MKRYFRISGLLVVLAFCCMSLHAEKGIVTKTRFGTGEDSIQCAVSLSLFNTFYRAQDYASTLVQYRKLAAECPYCSKNLFIRGIAIYKSFIEAETDQARRDAYIDTLMTAYDNLSLYGDRFVGEEKLDDMIQYKNDTSYYDEIYAAIKACREQLGEASSSKLIGREFLYSVEMAKAGKMTVDELLDSYAALTAFVQAKLDEELFSEEWGTIKAYLDQLLSQSGLTDCESLVKLYEPQFEANQNDEVFLNRMLELLKRQKCTDSDLFMKATEKQYALNPTPEAAYNMAVSFLRKGNNDKAIEYLNNLVKLDEASADIKADSYVLLGKLYLDRQNYEGARTMGQNALRNKANYGEAYILIGDAYVMGSKKCGESDFDQRRVYWAAVDKYEQARRDPDPETAAKAAQRVRDYSNQYPRKADAFFRNISEGDEVTINCWFTEKTKARFSD
ncbi:MAG: hypothetical protein K6F98_02860 [Bacteroidales bacterium]|nr:hypothetical protein [Bacteroidales bacterium]